MEKAMKGSCSQIASHSVDVAAPMLGSGGTCTRATAIGRSERCLSRRVFDMKWFAWLLVTVSLFFYRPALGLTVNSNNQDFGDVSFPVKFEGSGSFADFQLIRRLGSVEGKCLFVFAVDNCHYDHLCMVL